MSDDSNASQKILLEPLKNIGAQDILKVGSTYDGTLRKRGGRFQTLLKSSKWKQRFVVISQGCIYCFKDEYAERPMSAFSLAVYECVQETTFPNVLHVFEIKHEYTQTPSRYFACETEAKRKTWIAFIEDAITQAHQQSHENQKLSTGSDEGISMRHSKRRSHAPLPPLPPTPGSQPEGVKFKHHNKSEYSLESDDEMDEYSEINEHQELGPPSVPRSAPPKGAVHGVRVMPTGISKRTDTVSRRPALPLPDTPGHQPQSQGAKPKTSYEDVTTNATTGRPDYVNEEIFKEDEFFLNTSNKPEAHRLLNDQPVGTFLVRLGNSTPTVLSVQTPIGIREFQIAEKDDGKVSINKIQYFPNLPTMLCYYNQNELPKKEYSVKLIRGYNS